MGHGITATDGVFSVREQGWHRLATVFDHYPTPEEAKAVAHPWEPVQEPLYRRVPYIRPHQHTPECSPDLPFTGTTCDLVDDMGEEYVEAQSVVLNARSDNGAELGAVSPTYELVSNQDLYDISAAVEGSSSGDVCLETGGSLNGGRKVWLLLRLQEPIILDPRRPGEQTATLPYYALQNAHDGSGSLRGQAIMTRIICANTAAAADTEAEARGTEFVFHHTSSVRERIEDAKTALARWRQGVTLWQERQEYLLTLPAGPDERQAFLEQFVPMRESRVISDRVVQNVLDARRQVTEILDSVTCEGVRDTAYGLVQASVEYLNHVRTAKTEETRFSRAYLTRDRLAMDASRLAMAVCG